MSFVHTGCYGCKYNGWGGICQKDGICNGAEHYPSYTTTSTNPSNIPTQEFPEEIEINGVKYKRVK